MLSKKNYLLCSNPGGAVSCNFPYFNVYIPDSLISFISSLIRLGQTGHGSGVQRDGTGNDDQRCTNECV